jgi:serine/threonine-protein kinase
MVELETGTRLGRYELLVELGRGGMASVWVARETGVTKDRQRLVAVKVMLPELARDVAFRTMFLEEGALVRSIEHDNVVQVHEVAEDHGLLYMAMEWIEGDSLSTIIKAARKRRPIPWEMAVRIIADVASGLHAAHELRDERGELRGIVHCDVSPHNILMGCRGQAKLADFGVAQAATRSDSEGAENLKGKFGYMSPEQVLGRKFDRRSDLFALGIVLYELTTGERLFKGEDGPHTLKLVASGPIPLPTSLDAAYPPELEGIVLGCLDRNPETRFQTAREIQVALEQFLVEKRILVSRAGVGQLVKRVIGQRIHKRRESIRSALSSTRVAAETSEFEFPSLTHVSQVSAAPLLAAALEGGGLDSEVSTGERAALAEATPLPESTSRGGRMGWLVAGIVFLSVAAVAVVVRLSALSPHDATITETGAAAAAPPPAREVTVRAAPNASAAEDTLEATSLEALPSEAARTEARAQRSRPAGRPAPKDAGSKDGAAKDGARTAPAAQPAPPAPDGDPGFKPMKLPPVPANAPDDDPAPNVPRASGRAG